MGTNNTDFIASYELSSGIKDLTDWYNSLSDTTRPTKAAAKRSMMFAYKNGTVVDKDGNTIFTGKVGQAFLINDILYDVEGVAEISSRISTLEAQTVIPITTDYNKIYITHKNVEKYPTIEVLGTDGSVVTVSETHISNTQTVLEWDFAFEGRIIINMQEGSLILVKENTLDS